MPGVLTNATETRVQLIGLLVVGYSTTINEEIAVATQYRIGGKLTSEFPMTLRELEMAEPVYETFPGFAEAFP